MPIRRLREMAARNHRFNSCSTMTRRSVSASQASPLGRTTVAPATALGLYLRPGRTDMEPHMGGGRVRPSRVGQLVESGCRNVCPDLGPAPTVEAKKVTPDTTTGRKVPPKYRCVVYGEIWWRVRHEGNQQDRDGKSTVPTARGCLLSTHSRFGAISYQLTDLIHLGSRRKRNQCYQSK